MKAKVLVLFTPTALCFQPGQAQGARQRTVPMEEVSYQGNFAKLTNWTLELYGSSLIPNRLRAVILEA
jgi:hypothetical protein